MRKHFLILMLMALLPMAGWAAVVPIIDNEYDVNVVPSDGSAVWCGGKPTVQAGWVIVQSETAQKPTKAQVADQIEIRDLADYNIGNHPYALQLKAGALGYVDIATGVEDHYNRYYLHTNAQNTATLTITKFTGDPVIVTNQLQYVTSELTYTGEAQNLLTLGAVEAPDVAQAATATANGFAVPVVYALSKTAETWTADYTTLKGTDAGTYHVWYKVADTNNYQGTDPEKLTLDGKVIGAGTVVFDNIKSAVVSPATALTYDGSDQQLLTKAENDKPLVNFGAAELLYRINSDSDEDWAALTTLTAITGKNAGEYAIDLKVPATANYNIGTTTINVTIARAVVDETKVAAALADPDETFTFNYAEHTPDLTVSYSNAQLTVDNGDIAIAYADNINAGNATATVTFNNYYLGDDPSVAYTKPVTFTIAPKSLGDDNGAAEGITTFLQPGASAWTYNGEERSYTSTTTKVRYTVGDTPHNLDRKDDYTRTPVGDFTNATDGVAEADKPYYLFTGKGNFTGTVKLYVTIAKADLTATVKSQNIAFGDDLPANAIDETTIVGLQGNDVFATVVPEITYTYKQNDEVVENPSAVGDYSIEATATAANYNVTFTAGTLTIGNATAVIVPIAKSKLYGAADPTLAWKVEDAQGNALDNSVLGGTVTLARQQGEDVNTYLIYVVSYTPDAGDSYTVDQTKFGENGKTAPFTIFVNPDVTLKLKFTADAIADKASKVYDGTTDVTFDADDLEVADETTLLNGDTWETIKVHATVAAVLKTTAGEDVVKANVGDYKVYATVTGLNNYAAVEVVDPLDYEITKRPLKIKVDDQAFAYGSNINPDAWSVDDSNSGYNVVGVDDTGIELYTVKDIKEYAPGSSYEDAIQARIPDTFTSNYAIATNSEWGTLTITDVTPTTVLAMRSSYEDNADDEFTTIQAYNGKTVTVEITVNRTQTLPETSTTYTWKGEDWNAFILPFSITPKQLSEAFGYAIVNVVNPDKTTDGNVAFRLNMSEEIPANTPFMLKNYVAVEPNTVINFGEKTIVAPENAEVSVNAGAGINFIGRYNTKTIGENMSNLYFYNGEGAWKHLKAATATSWKIAPFNAYMEMPATSGAQEFTFTFEEPDGKTTAIKSVSVDESDSKLNAEGWYNLNGVKMQSAPTQKGVYIKDGKKVVIK